MRKQSVAMNTNSGQRKDYTGLRSIRGIGAVLIFYHHFGFGSAVTESFGDFGVALFFMLSGLVLSMSYSDRVPACNKGSVGSFLKKRAVKIYPVYILSLAAAILINGYDMLALPFDITLLQSWIPDARIYFSGNAVSWFVSSLFFSYLVFLPLQKSLTTNPMRFMKCFGIGMIAYIIIVSTLTESLVKGIIYINPIMEVPAFVLGMLVWHFFGHRRSLNGPSKKSILMLQSASIIIVLVLIYLYRYVNPRWSLASYWWLPNVFLLAVLLISEEYPTPVNRFLNLRILRFAGNVSFTFYLFHTTVITLYNRILAYLDINIDLFPSSLVCLALTLAIAYLLHRYVELPVAKKLKSVFNS